MYKEFYRKHVGRLDPTYIPPVPKTDERLTGFVQGINAAKDEERFARALIKNSQVRGYEFRMAIGAPKGMPGWRELDFLVYTFSGYRAFEIDDTSFIHRGESASVIDRIKDLARIQGLAGLGVDLRYGIEHVDAVVWLQNQPDADRRVRELI